ncbi:hypothetical protein [Klebsiella quasipneumoniae]|uniref:hypothetical protein n=1 Tax=Klebsiella quasipneumoniae TaxID=1463165 RepID=UPI0022E03E41|nr:hypothetical protein [Klebsiella quasipneumoniae]
MKSRKTLTFAQFLIINSQLAHISDTWADLWALIYYTGLSVGRLLALRYEDISGDLMLIREHGRLKALRIELTPPVMTILNRRRGKYPEDVFVFQSHSNRVKNKCRSVTVIAFNTALRNAAKSIPEMSVSSRSARKVTT